jgi:hypothetical protein
VEALRVGVPSPIEWWRSSRHPNGGTWPRKSVGPRCSDPSAVTRPAVSRVSATAASNADRLRDAIPRSSGSPSRERCPSRCLRAPRAVARRRARPPVGGRRRRRRSVRAPSGPASPTPGTTRARVPAVGRTRCSPSRRPLSRRDPPGRRPGRVHGRPPRKVRSPAR